MRQYLPTAVTTRLFRFRCWGGYAATAGMVELRCAYSTLLAESPSGKCPDAVKMIRQDHARHRCKRSFGARLRNANPSVSIRSTNNRRRRSRRFTVRKYVPPAPTSVDNSACGKDGEQVHGHAIGEPPARMSENSVTISPIGGCQPAFRDSRVRHKSRTSQLSTKFAGHRFDSAGFTRLCGLHHARLWVECDQSVHECVKHGLSGISVQVAVIHLRG